MFSESLKRASAEQEVSEKKSEVIGKSESITFDGQGGSLQEEGTATVSQKLDSNSKFKMADDTTKFYVVKKQSTLRDSFGTSPRSAKVTVTYIDTSDGSDIEIDDMKHINVQKEAALKDSHANFKDEESGDEMKLVLMLRKRRF
jgi:hypothetical protein